MVKKKETVVYCLKGFEDNDYIHHLESIGVFAREGTGSIFQVFKCSQCKKIILEELEEITRVFQ